MIAISLSILVSLSLTSIFFSEIVLRFNTFIGVSNGSTVLILLLNLLTVFLWLILTFKSTWHNFIPPKPLLFIKLYIFWGVFSLFHGVFSVTEYFEWKRLLLNFSFSVLIPLSIILALREDLLAIVIRFFITKLFIIAFFLLPLTFTFDGEMYSRAVVLITLFLFFVPYVKLKWKVFFIAVALLSALINFDYRINIIKIAFALILATLVYKSFFLRNSWLNFALLISFLTPIILLYLGIIDVYNIFRDGLNFDYEYTTILGGVENTTQLGADTRTFLFREVFSSMLYKDSSFLIGEGGGAGYISEAFADSILTENGRGASEVGFLNQLLFSGIIGVALYALVIFSAAYYGVNKSNNYLTKMLSLFLAFHWVLFFIEDQIMFNMNNLAIWLAIGMTLSSNIRNLSDNDLKILFKNSLSLGGIRWR
jgi:hypothetical protein